MPAATQQLADVFAARIAEQPADWHMLQKLWLADLDPARLQAGRRDSVGLTMRIGIVCPYQWDIPGGVQSHVRDLAETLIGLGHRVSVLAPGDEDTPGLPDYVVAAGKAVPIPVQRFGGAAAVRAAVGDPGPALAEAGQLRRGARA